MVTGLVPARDHFEPWFCLVSVGLKQDQTRGVEVDLVVAADSCQSERE